jgi:hypothetical protein
MLVENWCKACGGEIMDDGCCRECGLTARAGRDAYYGRMPKTSKEKQEDFRARMALLGMKEVRGIYLPEALHPVIKEQAVKLLEKQAKDDQRG